MWNGVLSLEILQHRNLAWNFSQKREYIMKTWRKNSERTFSVLLCMTVGLLVRGCNGLIKSNTWLSCHLTPKTDRYSTVLTTPFCWRSSGEPWRSSSGCTGARWPIRWDPPSSVSGSLPFSPEHTHSGNIWNEQRPWTLFNPQVVSK